MGLSEGCFEEYCYDCDPWELYSERRVKAKKVHTCSETGRTIYPGEYYYYIFTKCDGRVETYKFKEEIFRLYERTRAPFNMLIECLKDTEQWNEYKMLWER